MSTASSSVLSSTFLSKTPPSPTPSQSAAIRQCEIPLGLEKRVKDATSQLSGDRCIIRNTRESTCYSYLLPRGTPERILTRLEYAWGMGFGQLNVNSSSNVLHLSSDLHKSFQHALWILIPEDRNILKAHRRHKKRGPKENDFASLFPAGPYRYKLVPSRFLKFEVIERVPNLNSNSLEHGHNNDLSRSYSYPFSDFPTIVSHVHPRFVIYHAGRSLVGRQYTFLHARPDLLSAVERIISIYKSWTRPIPPPDIRSFVRMSSGLLHSDGHNIEDDCSDSSRVTRAERFDWRNQDDKERQPEVLERGMLIVFNALLPRDKTKTETISKWLSDVSTSPIEFDVDPLSATPLN